jgi:hypothetical protein
MPELIIKCSSLYCPYRDSCGLHKQSEDDDYIDQTYLNYEYTCNENSGFDKFTRK